MIKKHLKSISIPMLIIGLIMANGCNPGSNNDRSAGGKPTITVWSWNIAAKSLQQLAAEYNQAHPESHIKVEMTGARMSTRIMLSLAAGKGAPDISQFEAKSAPHYIHTERLTDLTPYAAKYKSMFPKYLWDTCSLNGKIYAIPWDMGPCAVYYKRDIFKKYDIDPSKIDTWDDFIKAGEEIKQKSGGHTKMLPLANANLSEIFEMLLQQSGGQVFDNKGNIAVNTPQVQQVVDLIRRMKQAGICANVTPYGQEWMAGFNDDTIATYPGAVWLGGIIRDASKDYAGNQAKWGLFRLPAFTHNGIHVANLGGSVLIIPDQCPNKEAAWKYVEYALCTHQGQIEQYKRFSLYPAFLPALQDSYMDKPDPFYGGQAPGRFFAMDAGKIQGLNRTEYWDEATGYLGQDLSHWAAMGMPEHGLLENLEVKLNKRLDLPISPQSRSLVGRR